MESPWNLPVWFVLIAGATALYIAAAWWAARRLERPLHWGWGLALKLGWYAFFISKVPWTASDGDTVFLVVSVVALLFALTLDVRSGWRFLKTRRAPHVPPEAAPN